MPLEVLAQCTVYARCLLPDYSTELRIFVRNYASDEADLIRFLQNRGVIPIEVACTGKLDAGDTRNAKMVLCERMRGVKV